MQTQREELAKRGIDHDDYDVFLSAPDPKMGIDDESTGFMVRDVKTGKTAAKTVPLSRRELAADPNGTVYYDTIVELVHELEEKNV